MKYIRWLACFLVLASSALAQNDNGNKKPADETLAKALAGDAKAQSNVGFLYELGGPDFPQDYAKAAEWYRKAAEQGYLLAARNLANLYKEGKGVRQDYREAEKWYRVGAEQNDPSSQNSLGDLYKERRDYGKASEWYQRAAAQGNVYAEGSLGLLYYQGFGVPKDYVLAHMWLNLAAARLSGPLSENPRKSLVKVRDLVEKEMTPDQLAEAQRLSREWKPQ